MTPELVRKVIRKRLADGTYGPGTQLPSERTLSVEFGVPKWVVSRALRPLRDNGDLHSSVGRRGTRVPDPQSLVPVTGISEIEQIVRSRIGDGTYAVRTWLPSLRHFAVEFGVTPTSIRTALKPLHQEKLLASFRTLGTYVVDPGQPGVPPSGRASKTVAYVGQALRERLGDGIYPPGSRLPAIQELATEFDVGLTTISKAIRPLRTEGLIANGPGRSYSARPTSEPPAPVRNATRDPVSCDAAAISEQDHQ
ncbi:DNA-binding GntR family transcriptional regulator [Streptomyces umbrinus]|uniref:DNA-binding GntR family transcriptional regulator n=1 Tax=Streptomyces umbrinus TaxID=67370 RepID=A0ABU0TCB9_9ACTN|nr:GntR family transcriptional regulator [Streptomyces umbrinus]MDQ1033468.1 DNA-binding GntR family transcriptional regulator [Streptomyces umbrinus]